MLFVDCRNGSVWRSITLKGALISVPLMATRQSLSLPAELLSGIVYAPAHIPPLRVISEAHNVCVCIASPSLSFLRTKNLESKFLISHDNVENQSRRSLGRVMLLSACVVGQILKPLHELREWDLGATSTRQRDG